MLVASRSSIWVFRRFSSGSILWAEVGFVPIVKIAWGWVEVKTLWSDNWAIQSSGWLRPNPCNSTTSIDWVEPKPMWPDNLAIWSLVWAEARIGELVVQSFIFYFFNHDIINNLKIWTDSLSRFFSPSNSSWLILVR